MRRRVPELSQDEAALPAGGEGPRPVDSVAATLDAVVAHGGEVVQPIGADAPEVTARFRDPAGNVLGLYQQPSDPAPAARGGA